MKKKALGHLKATSACSSRISSIIERVGRTIALYLSTQGGNFEGWNYVFNDPDPNFKSKKVAYMNNTDHITKAKQALLFWRTMTMRGMRWSMPPLPTRF